jgi:phosphatidylethanolamine/phosphatidyl-N-methylethanolamine N-methyltransferase
MTSNFYDGDYKGMFYSGGGVTSSLTRFIHKSLEKNLSREVFEDILEIGGGEGFHLEHVKCSYKKYYLTDISLRELTTFAQELRKQDKLIQKREDAQKLTFLDDTFDRTIFMCVLHHLSDVERALSEARRVTKNGGIISIYLPCDPGLIYVLMRKLVTFQVARRNNINYELINAREHLGHCGGIFRLVSYVFKSDYVRVRRFPFSLLDHNFNLFYTIQIIVQK